jgi:hypothetical protein
MELNPATCNAAHASFRAKWRKTKKLQNVADLLTAIWLSLNINNFHSNLKSQCSEINLSPLQPSA